MQFKLAHLSDLHLGPIPRIRVTDLMGKRLLGYLGWLRSRRHAHGSGTLDAILQDLSTHAVDHTAITGDLVNLALPGEFAAAARWLRHFGPPSSVTVVPGNHDAYVASAVGGWGHWAEYMGGSGDTPQVLLPFLRRCGPAIILGLSTAVPTPAGFASGYLGERQCHAFEQLLAGLEGDPAIRIVLLHHPPVAGWSRGRKALRDAARFRQIIARHGADLILCGHEHRLVVGSLDGPAGGVPVFGAPSASLGTEHGRRGGGYLTYGFTTGAHGWRIAAEHRAINPQTQLVEVRLRAALIRGDQGQRKLRRVA